MENTTPRLHPILAQVATASVVKLVLSPFNLSYRLHTSLGRETWAKLWYCLRALDQDGKGHYSAPIEMIEMLTGGNEKSIYRWLKQGKRDRAFRRYSCKKGILSVWLGSLSKTCTKLNLKDWGAVSVQNLLNLRLCRALTTATLTQKLQQASRYAANCKLKPQYRKIYGSPTANELLGIDGNPHLNAEPGQVPFVLHISESRLFVSKGFVCFGASQRAIGWEMGIRPITVQRHQRLLGMESRQLCQAKGEYSWIEASLDREMSEYKASDTAKDNHLGYIVDGDHLLFEDGIPKGSKKASVNCWRTPKEGFKQRFFRLGKKTWLAKCNIYREDQELKAMWAARSEYQRKVAQCQLTKKSSGVGDGDCIGNSHTGQI